MVRSEKQNTIRIASGNWASVFGIARCPLSNGAIKNLDFLIELRDEIEHRSTNRIDDAISAKLQACCINFNDAIKTLFGSQYGLKPFTHRTSQFVTFSSDQRAVLKKASTLPAHIETMMETFHHGLTEEEQADPRFAYRIAFVPKTGSRASNADLAIEFFKAGSDEARDINRVLLKEVDKPRYTTKQIVALMQSEGYPRFNQHSHTVLWKELAAKNPALGLVALEITRILGSGMAHGLPACTLIVRSTPIDTRN